MSPRTTYTPHRREAEEADDRPIVWLDKQAEFGCEWFPHPCDEGTRIEDTTAETLYVYLMSFYGGNNSSMAPVLSGASCIIHIPDVEHACALEETQAGTEKRQSSSKATLRIDTT